MKKPKTDRFDPKKKEKRIKPEDVDLSGVPTIKKKDKQPTQSPATEPAQGVNTPTSESKQPKPDKRGKDRPDVRMNETMNVRTNVRNNERTSERSKDRTKIRHSFDVYKDQLLSLKEIQLQRELVTGDKTLLGDLVQEALDLLIEKERTLQPTE